MCSRCAVSPMEPDPVVVHVDRFSTKAGYGGDDKPSFTLAHDSIPFADPTDFDVLCTCVRAAKRAMCTSLTKHPLYVIVHHQGNEDPMNEQLTQFCFEELGACALYLSAPSTLCLFNAGRTTGLVVIVDSHSSVA